MVLKFFFWFFRVANRYSMGMDEFIYILKILLDKLLDDWPYRVLMGLYV